MEKGSSSQDKEELEVLDHTTTMHEKRENEEYVDAKVKNHHLEYHSSQKKQKAKHQKPLEKLEECSKEQSFGQSPNNENK